MTITALPIPPSRQDPTNFAIRADSFLTALPRFTVEANDLVATVNGSKTAAVTSAGQAAASAGQAATSAANAINATAGSATTATNAANTAANAATAAANAANAAAGSATTATNAATTAANAATTAANAANAAAGSATTATNAANAASTSATTASTSATTASTSATTASTAATSASTAATAAASLLDNFDDRYLGSKTANPESDNDGSALLVGAIYWNSLDTEMKVWSGTAWVSVQNTQSSINAAASATEAADSATASASSATAAADSASAAAGSAASATEAADSAIASASSATAAADSATAALDAATTASTAATAAASLLDNFDDRYLGSKIENPEFDNDGSALLVGAIYWNSLDTEMKVWSGSTWVSVQNTQSSINAAASATAAADSATASASSATAAAGSATAAASLLDNFDDRYLGSKTANPEFDNDGSALLVGAIYWNSLDTEMKVWSGTAWVSVQNTQSSINAAASATEAADSATASAGSATAAAGSATNAAGSATVATTNLSNFQRSYLGPKTTPPTVDNMGAALQLGALYWNSSNSALYIWTGSAWSVGATSISGAVLSFNTRQGAITLSRSDVESVIPFATSATPNSLVLRDASGNFSGNIIDAVDFNSTSDRSLKTDITVLNTKDKFMELNPVEFTWKDSGKKSYGLIAQELEKIFPELVVERADGFKGVNYTPIIAMLIAQVQELSLKLEKLSV